MNSEQNNSKKPNPSGFRLISGAEIKPEPLSWLWHPYILDDDLNMIYGYPNSGRLKFAMWLAAHITNLDEFPTGDGSINFNKNGKVWYLTKDYKRAEKALNYFHANGGNRENLVMPGYESDSELNKLNPERLDEEIVEEIFKLDPDLIIFDDLISYLIGTPIDEYCAAAGPMQFLRRLIFHYRSTALVIHKADTRNRYNDALSQIEGDYCIASRCKSIVTTGGKSSKKNLYIAHVKSNNSSLGPTMKFKKDNKGKLIFDGASWRDADYFYKFNN